MRYEGGGSMCSGVTACLQSVKRLFWFCLAVASHASQHCSLFQTVVVKINSLKRPPKSKWSHLMKAGLWLCYAVQLFKSWPGNSSFYHNIPWSVAQRELMAECFVLCYPAETKNIPYSNVSSLEHHPVGMPSKPQGCLQMFNLSERKNRRKKVDFQ